MNLTAISLLLSVFVFTPSSFATPRKCTQMFSQNRERTSSHNKLNETAKEFTRELPEAEALELKLATEKFADVIEQQQVAFVKFAVEYKNFKFNRWLSHISDALRFLSGNSLESGVRMQRIRMGDRFYRIMRAGDTVRAVNYIRSIVSPVRTAAEIIFWSRAKIIELEARIAEGNLSPEQVAVHEKWIREMQKNIRQEAPYLARYGDMQMIVFQLIRLKNMYDTQLNDRVRNLVTQTYQVAMLESVPMAATALAKTSEIMNKELNTGERLTAAEIEQYINQRITDVTSKMYGMSGYRTVYPTIFTADLPFKTYNEPIIEAIKKEADFVASVFNAESQPGAYGAFLPIAAVHKREMAWEAVSSVRNLVSLVTTAYASLSRAVTKNSVNALAETRQGQDPQTNSVLRGLFDRVQGFTQSTRKALLWVLEDLAIWDAINLHAPKIDEMHELLIKYKQGFESREDFTTSVKSIFTPGDGTDIILSAARIVEFQADLNQVREILIERVKDIEAEFPNNKYASAPYANIVKDIDVAQKAVAVRAVREISLATEPNMVAIFAKQVITYSTATVISVGGILYMISPEAFNAVAGLVGIHI